MAKTRRKPRPVTLPPGFNGDIDLQMVDVPDPFEPSKTIRIVKNTRTPIKVLGGGDLSVALKVRVHLYSRSAVEKIEAAGGKAELL